MHTLTLTVLAVSIFVVKEALVQLDPVRVSGLGCGCRLGLADGKVPRDLDTERLAEWKHACMDAFAANERKGSPWLRVRVIVKVRVGYGSN